jgi:hypothetical protein
MNSGLTFGEQSKLNTHLIFKKSICMFYRVCLKILLITSLSIYAAGNSVKGQNARIKIDLDRTIGEVNKHIYGNFGEYPGRGEY